MKIILVTRNLLNTKATFTADWTVFKSKLHSEKFKSNPEELHKCLRKEKNERDQLVQSQNIVPVASFFATITLLLSRT